ncbi:MAG: antitoxin Xre-like helix-turn-helix domain-containing protein [Planctomycetota bacterium]
MAVRRGVEIPRPDPAAVLTKATLEASDRLGVSRRILARVIGVSEATLSRSGSGRLIDPASKEGELALLFVRLFRGLDALVGGDEAKAAAWLAAPHASLAAVPLELIQSASGLVHVVDHLDALRGTV